MTLTSKSREHAPLARPRAILFDHDGVLVESESLHAKAWARLLAEIGLQFDDTLYRTLMGKTAPQILARLLDSQLPREDSMKYDLDELALRKNDHYLKLAQTGLQPYPGVRELLAWLKSEGIRAAVVSNAKRRELVAAHEALGLTPWFDALISRDDSGAAKPDPTPYLMGAATLGFEPAECWAIEDSPPGLAAALQARVPAVGVLSGFPEAALEQAIPGRPDLRPVLIVKDIEELHRFLRNSTPK